MDETRQQAAFVALTQAITATDDLWPETLLHYTSAEALLKIFPTNSLLFSASSVTNDADELLGAFDIIKNTLVSSPSFIEWRDKIRVIWPEFFGAFATYFDKSVLHDSENLYLFCWCASDPRHPTGKLSVWRAYGADGKGAAFAIKTAPLKANRYTSKHPVHLLRTRYEDDAAFCATLLNIADTFLNHVDVFREIADAQGIDTACWLLFESWFGAAATRKHPGFSEEDEWRFIYIPRWDVDGLLAGGLEVNAVGGQLRPYFRLPIRDYSDLGMPGTDLKEILDYVIIGPNNLDHISAVKAVEMVLQKAGVSDARNKVRICEIPYRPAR